MNKAFKRIILSFFMCISFFFCITEVSANSVNKIEMDVYIDSLGNAIVTEVWNAYLDMGTEGYRTYTKLGNSSISNFRVSDDSGRTYESLSSWNVNSNFDSKAYKSGLNYKSDGVELCWGISNYGNRTYTLKYNINNLVTQYTDTQGIYFNFLNLDQSVGNAKIIIRSDIPLSLDNARIWAFGNNGSINFVDNKIILESGGLLSEKQYMVGLVRFETNLFNTLNSSDKSFDDIYDSAMSGVVNNNNNNNTSDNSFLGILIYFYFIMFTPIILVIVLFFLGKIKGKDWLWGSDRYSGMLEFGPQGKIVPVDSVINYWREIPCNKDLNRAYWVAYQYNIVPINILKEGILGAILLKWIKEGKVTVSKTRKGLFNFKDNNYAIDFSNMISGNNEIENDLFNMFKSASGFNNILEAKEFEKWCKKNYNNLDCWFLKFNMVEQSELQKQGLITDKKEITNGMFGKEKTIYIKNVSPQLREDAIQLKGLKKFLLDFSMMPEREYFEVHLWEEYLIFAQLLGIADKVEEQFSKLYPQFKEVSKLNVDITTIAVRNIVELGYNSAEYAKREAERNSNSSYDYSGSSTDSGGGGSSYSSGGSSSGGSSGGGFR